MKKKREDFTPGELAERLSLVGITGAITGVCVAVLAGWTSAFGLVLSAISGIGIGFLAVSAGILIGNAVSKRRVNKALAEIEVERAEKTEQMREKLTAEIKAELEAKKAKEEQTAKTNTANTVKENKNNKNVVVTEFKKDDFLVNNKNFENTELNELSPLDK